MDQEAGPSVEALGLSEHDREMLSRHAEDLANRERESREKANQSREVRPDDRKWEVEIPIRAEHPYAGLGREKDVKRGDRPDMIGRGTRRASHPIGNEKFPGQFRRT